MLVSMTSSHNHDTLGLMSLGAIANSQDRLLSGLHPSWACSRSILVLSFFRLFLLSAGLASFIALVSKRALVFNDNLIYLLMRLLSYSSWVSSPCASMGSPNRSRMTLSIHFFFFLIFLDSFPLQHFHACESSLEDL
jgi:hypothetical protein